MKELYYNRCKENTIHIIYDPFYRYIGYDSPNYCVLEIDKPDEFAEEELKRKELTDKLIVERRFPF